MIVTAVITLDRDLRVAKLRGQKNGQAYFENYE